MNTDKSKQAHRLYGLSFQGHNIRRLWHLSMIFSLCYYLVPEIMFNIGTIPFHRNYVIIILFIIVASLELLRITGKWSYTLFRSYEVNRISAPFWFCTTTALLVLLTPQWFAVPVIIGTTFADPVIGEMRRLNYSNYFIVGWVICITPYLLYQYLFFLAIFIGYIPAYTEVKKIQLKSRKSLLHILGITDDNFTMQVFPSICILIIWILTTLFGLDILPPGIEELLRPLY